MKYEMKGGLKMQDDIWGMTTGNPIRDKSFSFSLRIVKLYQHLTDKSYHV